MTTFTVSLPDEFQSLIERELATGKFTSKDELLREALHYWFDHRETIAALD